METNETTPLRFSDWFFEYTKEEYERHDGFCDCCGKPAKFMYAMCSEDPGGCYDCCLLTFEDEEMMAELAEWAAI